MEAWVRTSLWISRTFLSIKPILNNAIIFIVSILTLPIQLGLQNTPTKIELNRVFSLLFFAFKLCSYAKVNYLK